MNPDPRGTKTCGSGSGLGSGPNTAFRTVLHRNEEKYKLRRIIEKKTTFRTVLHSKVYLPVQAIKKELLAEGRISHSRINDDIQDRPPQTSFIILVQAIKKELLDEGSGEESGSGGESGTESDSEVTFQ
jgi:hypothetical protein